MGNISTSRDRQVRQPLLLFLLMCCSLFQGCAKNLPVNIRSNPPPEMKLGYLSGKLTTAEDNTLLLEDLRSKPNVLIFSQDTCVVCRGEASHIADWIRAQGSPTKIELVTVLIATILEDVQDFKSSLGITWNVAFEKNDLTFRSFCPQRKVPCVVIQQPGSGVVLAHEGPMNMEEIMSYTGDWK